MKSLLTVSFLSSVRIWWIAFIMLLNPTSIAPYTVIFSRILSQTRTERCTTHARKSAGWSQSSWIYWTRTCHTAHSKPVLNVLYLHYLVLRSIDNCKSPRDKIKQLEAIQRALTIGYTKFRDEKVSKEPVPAASELDPRFFYVFIKSIPRMMYSNLAYMSVFGLRKSGVEEYLCMLLRKTVHFVQNELSAKTLDMSEKDLKDNANIASNMDTVILISGFVKKDINVCLRSDMIC
eukprot:TRINITY_DN3476_c0_g1_i5.p1 TRINITY_DN3476_c0_g1~~TRINITY_DN3476_c0_g1_i5.p1  ORF type:complete len:234 (-),score=29.30 TRINITY_DN3476_c0_g1_i5:102-803(-)